MKTTSSINFEEEIKFLSLSSEIAKWRNLIL